MLKTLAAKHGSTGDEDGPQVHGQHRHTARAAHVLPGQPSNADGRKPLVARFGGIPLRRQKKAVLTDRRPGPVTYPPQGADHTAPGGPVRDLRATRTTSRSTTSASSPTSTTPGQPQPAWAQLMAKRRRKTLVVCPPATTPSTPATNHDTHGSSHWRARCWETGTAGSEGGRGKRTGTAGTSPDGLPCARKAAGRSRRRSGALGNPRDMAKAGLPESQSPEDASPSAGKTPETGAGPYAGSLQTCRRFSGVQERCPVRALKEMNGTPKSRSHV